MDGLLQLVDAGSFQAYAARVARNEHLKTQQLQAYAGMAHDDWVNKLTAFEEGHDFDRQGSVAVINIRGYLSYAYDFWTWWLDGCSYCGLMNKVNAAANDTSITKIILNVNSPGGGTIGVIEASDAIFNARKKKDIVSVLNPEAASAGYWLAAQANRIVMMESGFAGSIGAEIDYQSVAGWLKAEGIDVSVIRSEHAPDKNLGHRLEPISERATSYFQELCNTAGAKFIEHVARGRGVKEQVVIDTYGKGRMLFGSDAVRLGMADAIGNLADELASGSTSSNGMSAGRKRMNCTRAAADRSLRI